MQALESYIATSGNITNDVVVLTRPLLGAVRVQFIRRTDLSNASGALITASMLPSGGTATALNRNLSASDCNDPAPSRRPPTRSMSMAASRIP